MTGAKMTRSYDRYGWGWREKREAPGSRKWTLQKLAKIRLNLDELTGAPEEVVTRLRQSVAEADVEEPRITDEIEYGTYGDRDRDVLQIEGWRDATDDEILTKETEILEWEQKLREREDAEVERLRKTRPELFK